MGLKSPRSGMVGQRG